MNGYRSGLTLRRAFVVAATGALAVGLVACSSSAKSSSSSSAAASGASSAVKSATGAPIKVVSIIDTGPQGDGQWSGIQAAIKAINNSGGLNNRPIQASRCDTARDPQQAAKCAQQAVSDGVVATVGSETGYATNTDPILTAAGIPQIGGEAYTAADANTPTVFNATPGLAATTFALAPVLVKYKNVTKLGIPYIDNQAGAALPATIKGIVGTSAQIVSQVPIPLTATDLTAQVTTIKSSGATGLTPILAQTQIAPFYQTMEQLGVKLPVALAAVNGDIPSIAAKYPDIQFVVPGYFNQSSAGWQHFLTDMKASGATYTASDYIASGWLAVQVFAYGVQHATTVDAPGILAAMKSATAVNIGDITPPLNFTYKSPGLNGAFPGLVNTSYYPEEVQGGKLVSLNNWQPVNVFGS